MVRLIYFVYYFLSVSALAFSIFLIGKKGVSITVSMDYFADRNFGNNSYDFHNEKKISISEDRRINSTVRWGIRFMLVNKMLLNVIAIFLLFFNVFYKKKEKNSNCDWIHHFCSLAVAAFEC